MLKSINTLSALRKSNCSRIQMSLLVNLFSSNERIKLEDVEQKAVVSFFAMKYIMDFKPQMYITNPSSIRERLLNKKEFQAFVLSKLNSVSSKICITNFQELGLEQKNIQQVLSGFQLSKGMVYDPRVFSQTRMKRAAQNSPANNQNIIEGKSPNELQDSQNDQHMRQGKLNRIILNPLIFSGQIIHAILSGDSRIVSGDKGIGKSFTYLLYSYLSSFIIEARLQNKYFNLDTGFYKRIFRYYRNFYKVQKLFYVPIRYIKQQKDFYELLTYQMTEQEAKKKVGSQNSIGISDCLNYYYYQKIGTFIVFDEINSFYSDARRYFMKLDKGKEYDKLVDDLFVKSQILNKVRYKTKLILNSSQDVQASLLKEKLKNARLFNYYEHQDSPAYNVKIDYTSFSSSLPGLVQIYCAFWFQLSILLINKGVNEKLIQEKRWIFQKAFNLSNQSAVPWKNNIFPLDIRIGLMGSQQIVEKIQNGYSKSSKINIIQPVDLSNLADYIKRGTDQKIEDQLKDIKTKIQKSKIVDLQNKLNQFISHSTDDYYRKLRLSVIMLIRSKAYQNVGLGKQNFAISTKLLYQLQLPQFQSKTGELEIRVPQFQQINFCISQLKIGIQDKSVKIYKIGFRPEEFLEKSSFVLQRIQFLEDIYEGLIKYNRNAISGSQIGGMLDGGMSRIFKRGFLKFNYIQHLQKESKVLVENKSKHIIHSCIIQNLASSKDLRGCLNHMFEDCRNNNYAGYLCGVPDAQNNQGFDFALLWGDKSQNQFNLITVDITSGSIEAKLQKNTSQAKLYLNQSQKAFVSFIQSVIKTNDQLKNFTGFINQIKLKQTLGTNELITIGFEIFKNFHVKDHIWNQRDQMIENKSNFYLNYMACISQSNLLKIIKYVKLRGINIEKSKSNRTVEQTSILRQKIEVSLKEIQSSQNSGQLFQQLCVLVKFVKMVSLTGFVRKEQLIRFIENTYNPLKDADDVKIIPQQLQLDPRMRKHHFFSPFKLLRGYQEPEGLRWTHLIAAPSHKVQQYKNGFEKAKKERLQLGKEQLPFLFKEYSEKYGNGVKSLEFGLAELPFDEKMIQLMPKPLEQDNRFLALKRQYLLLRKLIAHI